MKMKYAFNEEDKNAIKEARKNTRDKQQDRRLKVLELRCEGMKQKRKKKNMKRQKKKRKKK